MCFALSCVTSHGHAQTITQEGQHLRLTGDVVDEELLTDLVASFDAAVPQWLAFWGLPAARADNWKISGYLMRDREAFQSSGVLPNSIPAFKNGYATPTTIWVTYQNSVYYNRHLLLHEGVHALAMELFGGNGPSWYMEGTAELLATHRDRQHKPPSAHGGLLAQAGGEFRINELPASRSDAPLWGRYRIVQQRRDAGTLPTLASVLKLPADLQGDVDSYTWCWAAAMMFTAYPDTRQAFVSAAERGRDQSPAFTTRFFREIEQQWPALRARWRVWLDDLEYGFDPQLALVDLSTEDPRYDDRSLSLDIQSDRGWQSAGAWFPPGTLRVQAQGDCVIVAQENIENNVDDPAVVRNWISTPEGISVHHHRGYPIGQLQYCVLPIPRADLKTVERLAVQPLSESQAQTIRIDVPSWLLFRIHDAPGKSGRYQRADNQGAYQVHLAR